MKSDELQARLDRLWGDADSIRAESWFRRAWLKLSRRADEVRSSALVAFASAVRRQALRKESVRIESADVWTERRDAVWSELARNVDLLEDRARAGEHTDAGVLSWLYDVNAWARAMDRLNRQRVFASEYSLMHGLGARAFRGPDSVASPLHVMMSVDSLCREAAEETNLLNRREALLRAAQRILLDAAASVDGVSFTLRQKAVHEELRQLRRMSRVANLSTPLDQQIRDAAKQGDRQLLRGLTRVRAYLRAESPVDDAAMRLAASPTPASPSQVCAVRERYELPASVNHAIGEGYKQARAQLEQTIEAAPPMQRFRLQGHAADLKQSAQDALVRMTFNADSSFDVGVSFQRGQRETVEERREVVPYPTATLSLSPVDQVSGIADALIEDPRLLLYHLASRRLLQRRYIRREMRRGRSASVRASVRFYLLDGSSSMRGARGRMRDAIFVAELASLVERLERPDGRIRSLLYYRYFDAKTEVTRRVATAEEALSTIRAVLSAQRGGGTDIQSALLESLSLIGEQRDNDVELSRAQLVLVTDGQAEVDPDILLDAQRQLDVPVRVSVIALGEENQALRRFAAQQNNAGLQVIYHHVDDAELLEQDAGDYRAQPEFVLTNAVPGLDEAPTEEGDEIELEVAALQELGLDDDALSASRRQTLEVQRLGRVALGRRFDNLFPPPTSLPLSATSTVEEPGPDAVVVLNLLSVVVEVLVCTPSSGWRVQSDAIAIMTRLLREHGMSKSYYTQVLRSHPSALRRPLDALRALVG